MSLSCGDVRDAADSSCPPLALPSARVREMLVEAAHWVADYLSGVADRPVTTPRDDAQRRDLAGWPVPATGQPVGEFLAFVDKHVAPFPCGNGHPAFFGWINSAPAPLAVVAELIGAGLNPSNGMGEHAAVDLERAAIAGLADLAGLPAGTGGVLTSGGSMANLLCLAAARSRHLRRTGAEDGPRYAEAHPALVCYQSDQAHMSIAKAARTIGLSAAQLRTVPTDADYRMDVTALRTAICADLDAGLIPFAVVSTAGTTATGAIDPLSAIAQVAAEFGLWHHVDGAFGGLGAAHPDLAGHYAAIGQADSLTVDPHKTLNTPIGIGAALVARPDDLRHAFGLTASYLDGNNAWPWLSEYTVELTRPGGRALAVWAVLHQLGRTGVTALLDHYLTLTSLLRQAIEEHPELEPVAAGPWSVTCFRVRGADDAATAATARRLQERGNVFLATVSTKDGLALRASICSHLTTTDDIDALVQEVTAIGRTPSTAQ